MEISVIDILGHIGYISLLLGTILLAYQKRTGWIFRVIGEAIWIYLGLQLALTSVWFWSILFVVWDTVGFFKWKKKPL